MKSENSEIYKLLSIVESIVKVTVVVSLDVVLIGSAVEVKEKDVAFK